MCKHVTFGNAALRHGLSLIVFLKWIDYSCKDPEESDNDCPSVTYPSSRLATITRKSNEIKRLMDGEKTAENKANACQLVTKLKTKINCFQEDKNTALGRLLGMMSHRPI